MRRGYAFAGLLGVALATAPAAQARPLKGPISLNFSGGRAAEPVDDGHYLAFSWS